MNIAYVNLGGLPNQQAHAVQIFNTCSALAAEGAAENVAVWCAAKHAGIKRGKHAAPGNWPLGADAYFGVAPNFHLMRPARLWQNLFKRQKSAARQSAECLRAIERAAPAFDVVYTRQPLFALHSARANIKTALEVHDLDALEKPEMRTLLQEWQNGQLPALRGLVAISQTLANGLTERGIPAAKLLVAHDGIDTTRFANPLSTATARAQIGAHLPPNIGLDGARPIVGYCGHFYRGRGIELLIECARRRPDWTFLLIGGLPEDLERYQSGAPSNVIFTGHVANTALPPLLWACDVLTMPYQFDQPQSRFMSPMKMFEYMATGRAIVSADWPQIREVLQSEEHALFYPRDNCDALEAALERALGDEQLRQKLGANARRAVENYTWRARARRILDWLGDGTTTN